MAKDLCTNEEDSQLVKEFKITVTKGLKGRFSLPEDEGFEKTLPAVASFLDPRHKSLSYIAIEQVKSNLKSYVLCLMEKENPTVEKERDDEPPMKKMKSVHSYLDGDFMEVDTGDGMEGEMNIFQSQYM